MNYLHDLAQLLISCWVLSDETARTIPTSHGVLDRALQAACNADALPSWAREKLHFVDSRIGLQCVELGGLLDSAQKAELTSAPNPSYQTTLIRISPRVARILLRRLGVQEDDARNWGRTLRAAAADAKDQLQSFDGSAGIEEY